MDAAVVAVHRRFGESGTGVPANLVFAEDGSVVVVLVVEQGEVDVLLGDRTPKPMIGWDERAQHCPPPPA